MRLMKIAAESIMHRCTAAPAQVTRPTPQTRPRRRHAHVFVALEAVLVNAPLAQRAVAELLLAKNAPGCVDPAISVDAKLVCADQIGAMNGLALVNPVEQRRNRVQPEIMALEKAPGVVHRTRT